MKKFVSRKLILTTAAIILVAVVNLLGAPLDEAALNSITTMVLGLVGAQGLVDFGAAWKAGSTLAEVIDDE